jgi:penicillin-binding protein-related factor A (putative recombinase)
MRGGNRPRAEGKGFEGIFETVCQLQGLKVIKVPEAGRWIGRGAFKPIPGMCDFIIIDNGRVAFVDTKSIDQEVFPASLISPNQLEHLTSVGDVCPAGYVVCFRPIQRVVYFPWNVLLATPARTSLSPADGIDLGQLSFFSVKKIFACH